MSKILTKDECKEFWDWIQRASKDIPIRWDRVTVDELYATIFGWIEQKEKPRDFVSILYFRAGVLDDTRSAVIYQTSSAKYTRQIGTNLASEGHNGCKEGK